MCQLPGFIPGTPCSPRASPRGGTPLCHWACWDHKGQPGASKGPGDEQGGVSGGLGWLRCSTCAPSACRRAVGSGACSLCPADGCCVPLRCQGEGRWVWGKNPALPGRGSAEYFPKLSCPPKATETHLGKAATFCFPLFPICRHRRYFCLFSTPQDTLIIAFQPGSLCKPSFPGLLRQSRPPRCLTAGSTRSRVAQGSGAEEEEEEAWV